MTRETPPIFFDHLSPAAERLLIRAGQHASRRGGSSISIEDLHRSLEYESPLLLPAEDTPSTHESRSTTAGENAVHEFDETVKAVLRRARELSLMYSRLELLTTKDILISLLESSDESRRDFASRGMSVDSFIEEYHRDRTPPPINESLEPDSEQPPSIDILRIVDANLNRVREAVRVIEESLRFVGSQKEAAERIKQARHRLGALTNHFPLHGLLRSRDAEEDVGRGITVDSEQSRESIEQIAVANFKRSQEGLRAIEEYAKAGYAAAAGVAKDLRYDLYSLEKAVLLNARRERYWRNIVLYWLFDPSTCRHDPRWTFDEASAGGVQAVQLRIKGVSDRELVRWGQTVREWCARADVLFIMNDRPDLARLCEADAVHLGQDDLSVRDARRIVGPGMEIGISTHSLAQAEQAVQDGADYLGVGPLFHSATKAFDDLHGVELLAAVASKIDLPFFAIGGIGPGNVTEVVKAGASRIAVSQAIQGVDEPGSSARSLRAALKNHDREV